MQNAKVKTEKRQNKLRDEIIETSKLYMKLWQIPAVQSTRYTHLGKRYLSNPELQGNLVAVATDRLGRNPSTT